MGEMRGQDSRGLRGRLYGRKAAPQTCFGIELWWNSELCQGLTGTRYSKRARVLPSGERQQRSLRLGTRAALVLPVRNTTLVVCQGMTQNGRKTLSHAVSEARLEYSLK